MNWRVLSVSLLISACIALFIGSIHVHAESHNETPIHLKIDKFFILYTLPSPPFVDAKQRLLIPLRANQDLMGGTVSYDDSTKTATILLLNHRFEVTINSNIAQVDGMTIHMDTTPILKNGSMFLPIRLFLDHTDVKYAWDQKMKLLHITDERVAEGQPFKDFAGNDFTSGYEDGAFSLTSFEMTLHSLSIKALNISGKNIAKGKSDIHPLVSFKDKGGFSTDSYTRPIYPALPEVIKDSSITVTQQFDMKNVAYIISVGRREP